MARPVRSKRTRTGKGYFMESELCKEETRHGLKIKIFQDTDSPGPDNDQDSGLFLVHYHRSFEVTRPEVIDKPQAAAWYRGEKDERLSEIEKRYHLFSVAAYIHSGVVLSLGDGAHFPDQRWDVSHVGIVLASKKEWRQRKSARKAAAGLVNTWNDHLSGNVYGFVIEDAAGNNLESCWGFSGEDEKEREPYALVEARAIVDRMTHKGTTDHNGQLLMFTAAA